MSSISHLKGELQELLTGLKLNGHTALVVGSCTEWLVEHSVGERVSEFWTGSITYEDRDLEVTGYLNSQAELSPIWAEGSLLYTLLHGPVLAKSENLADHILSKLVGKDLEFVNADLISSYVREAVNASSS
jgi:hypothetical protein